MAIFSYIDKDLEDCWLTGDSQKLPASLRRIGEEILLCLDIMNVATLEDLMHVPLFRVEPPRGKTRVHRVLLSDEHFLYFRYEHGSFHDVWVK